MDRSLVGSVQGWQVVGAGVLIGQTNQMVTLLALVAVQLAGVF
jgi:hypothetical protein